MTTEFLAESGLFSLDLDARAVWSTAFINDLPDSAFLYIEKGGSKDDGGKTTPRGLRHFPYKDSDGKIDLPHLRNALARIPQSSLPAEVKARLTRKAQKLLAGQDKTRAADDMDGDECANCGHSLDDHDGDEGDCTAPGCDCNGMSYATAGQGELRYATVPIIGVEVRDAEGNGDGTWTMSGYAAVFDQRTTLYDGKFSRLTEDIDPAAFDKVLRTQGLHTAEGAVHLNFGHDMNRVVAATDVPPGQPGWLDLSADTHGLRYLAKVSKDDPDAIAMAVKMRNGVLKQASFAFTIGDAQMSDVERGPRLETHRRITQVGMLRDVCVAAQGAYPQTVSQLRSYAAAIGQPTEQVGAIHVSPSEQDGGVIAVSLDQRGGVASRRLNAAQLRGVARHTKKEPGK